MLLHVYPQILILSTLLYSCISHPTNPPNYVPSHGTLAISLKSDEFKHTANLPIHPKRSKRDDTDDGHWRLVLNLPISAIEPFDLGAAAMAHFYHLVFQAATGRWRAHRPQARLEIAWRRVAMVMLVQGLETIPWELLAEFAEGMMNQINGGHVGFTYDGYFLQRQRELARPHGLYVRVRLMGQQEAVDVYLAAGRYGILDPSNP